MATTTDAARLWIVETTTGTKRTYKRTGAEARESAERRGLTVLRVRQGTEADSLESQAARIIPSRIVHTPRRAGSYGQFFGVTPIPNTGDGPHTYMLTGWLDADGRKCRMRDAIYARGELYGWTVRVRI